MPNWKKVIVSGSSAVLTSVTATAGFTGSLSGSATSATSASYALTASYVLTTQTASYVQNAVTASYVLNAVSASYATIALNASMATSASYSVNSTTAATASYVLNAVSASYATQALSSSYALTTSNSQNAQDILIYVKNVTGAQINKGKVVRISGATGDNALIATASYESDGVSANTLGITSQDIPNDSFGYVITEGTLIGINTNAFSAGQLLYLGATGSIIGTAPVAPLHAVRLGQVLRVQINNGSMYVRIDNGYELGELHDVVDTTTTSSYGDLLIKSGSVWGNSKQLTGSYGLTGSLNATSFTGSLLGTSSYATQALSASFATSTAAVAGTTNYVPKFTSATTLGNSQIFDNGTNVGIGTTTPSSELHLQGTTTLLTITDTTYNRTSEIGYLDQANLYLANDNSSNTYIGRYNNLFLAYGGGFVGITNTTPTQLVDIGATGTQKALRVRGTYNFDGAYLGSSTTNGGSKLELVAHSDTFSSSAYRIRHDRDATQALTFDFASPTSSYSGLNYVERMRITDAGDVGINNPSPSSKLDTNGSIASNSGLSNASTRPAVSAGTLTNGEVRGYSVTSPGADDGFLRVSAGGGTNANTKTYIDLSGYSTVSDMDKNIVIGTSGAEVMRIGNSTVVITGSLIVSQSLDTSNRTLYDDAVLSSVGWNDRILYDQSSLISLDWATRTLNDGNELPSVNWDGRFLLSAASGIKTLDWISDYWLSSPVYQKDNKSRDLQNTVSSLGVSGDTYLGDIIQGQITSAGSGYPSEGQLVFLYTDGFWYTYDQTDTNIYGKMVGLAFDVDTGGGICNVLLEGHVLIADNASPVVQSVDYGLPVYIRDGALGMMSTVSPSSGIVQVLGHCYHKNSVDAHYWMMKFRPSMDWYKI